MMVLAFLRDSRRDEERRRADPAEAELRRVLSLNRAGDLIARIRRLQQLSGMDADAADNRTFK